MRAFSRTELLVTVIARLLRGCRHVAVGASSPIPGSGALLARSISEGNMRVSVLGSRRNNFFTNGGVELFDLAAEGRIDAFFLGGGQIDGQGNINLVGVGGYPRGNLFREEHTRRVMVPQVDFVSAPGTTDGVHRPGGPFAMVTGLGLFYFDRNRRRFRLASVHPGHTVEEIRDNTGFDFDCPAVVPETPGPDETILATIRGPIRGEIAETYPRFAVQMASH
jgi:glutaconate CoA-transferase subunit B